MIIKTMSRRAYIGRSLTYLFKDPEKLQSKDRRPVFIRKNVRSKTIEAMRREFEQNEALRKYKRRDATKLYSTVLSFHEKDSQFLDEKTLTAFAKEYMHLRGQNMYVAVAHYDTPTHIHLHICESGTQYMTGLANRMSKKEYHALKVAMQTFQIERYPYLQHSVPKHGRGYSKEKATSIAHNREGQKQELLTLLQQLERTARSQTDFLHLIQQAGHTPYYRSGRLTGILHQGDRKFRFSRLGYDTEKLQNLDKQLVAKEQLRQIRSKAQGRTMERERTRTHHRRKQASEWDDL